MSLNFLSSSHSILISGVLNTFGASSTISESFFFDDDNIFINSRLAKRASSNP